MPLKLQPFKGPGSTPARRRFWNDVTSAVLSSQKLAGRHASVDEHTGKGSVINVASTSDRRRPRAGCAANVTVRFSGLVDPCCATDIDADGSYNITGIGTNLNDRDIVLPYRSDFACDPSQCAWYVQDVVLGGEVVVHYFSDAVCGAEFHTEPDPNQIAVYFISGIYYIVAWIIFAGLGEPVPDVSAYFYAETASLAGSVPNMLTSCSSTFNDGLHVDNAFSTCFFGGPFNFTSFAHDGIVTVTI